MLLSHSKFSYTKGSEANVIWLCAGHENVFLSYK